MASPNWTIFHFSSCTIDYPDSFFLWNSWVPACFWERGRDQVLIQLYIWMWMCNCLIVIIAFLKLRIERERGRYKRAFSPRKNISWKTNSSFPWVLLKSDIIVILKNDSKKYNRLWGGEGRQRIRMLIR